MKRICYFEVLKTSYNFPYFGLLGFSSIIKARIVSAVSSLNAALSRAMETTFSATSGCFWQIRFLTVNSKLKANEISQNYYSCIMFDKDSNKRKEKISKLNLLEIISDCKL